MRPLLATPLLSGCAMTPQQDLHTVLVACKADQVVQPIIVQLVVDFTPYGGIAAGVDNALIHPAAVYECDRLTAKFPSAVV